MSSRRVGDMKTSNGEVVNLVGARLTWLRLGDDDDKVDIVIWVDFLYMVDMVKVKVIF